MLFSVVDSNLKTVVLYCLLWKKMLSTTALPCTSIKSVQTRCCLLHTLEDQRLVVVVGKSWLCSLLTCGQLQDDNSAVLYHSLAVKLLTKGIFLYYTLTITIFFHFYYSLILLPCSGGLLQPDQHAVWDHNRDVYRRLMPCYVCWTQVRIPLGWWTDSQEAHQVLSPQVHWLPHDMGARPVGWWDTFPLKDRWGSDYGGWLTLCPVSVTV